MSAGQGGPEQAVEKAHTERARVAQSAEHRGCHKDEGTPSQAVSEVAGSSPAPGHQSEWLTSVLADFAEWAGCSADDAEWAAETYMHERAIPPGPRTPPGQPGGES